MPSGESDDEDDDDDGSEGELSGDFIVPDGEDTEDVAGPSVPLLHKKRAPTAKEKGKGKAVKAVSKKTKKPAKEEGKEVTKKTKKPAAVETREISVTISAGARDIDEELLHVMEKFLEDHCEAGLVALERGGTVYHLHMQAILRIECTCTRSVGLRIRAALQWKAGADPPAPV